MKKIVLLFAIVSLSFPYFASSQETGKQKILDNWSLNINGGASIFWGDIRQYKFYPIYHFENERNISYGIILSKQLSPIFELRGQLIKGNLSGTNRAIKRYFESEIFEYNLNTTLNFSQLFLGDNIDRKLSFYGIVGMGFLNFRTMKKVLGDNTYSYSRGYSKNGIDEDKMQTETVIPLGFGFKYKFGKRFEANFENIFNATNTDLIDATIGGFKYDFYTYTSLGVTYKFNLRIPKGNKKGVLVNNENIVKKEETLPTNELIEKIKYLENQVKRLENRTEQILIDNKNKENEEKSNKENLIKSIYKSILDTIQSSMGTKINCKEDCLPISIFFNVNKYDILDSEKQKLASIAELLKKDKTLKLRIIGRTDQSGTAEYNNYLSKKRAQAVLSALVNKYKIDKSLLIIETRGKDDPFSEKHYSVNRRVDFIKQ